MNVLGEFAVLAVELLDHAGRDLAAAVVGALHRLDGGEGAGTQLDRPLLPVEAHPDLRGVPRVLEAPRLDRVRLAEGVGVHVVGAGHDPAAGGGPGHAHT
jgi:hypothetical protein